MAHETLQHERMRHEVVEALIHGDLVARWESDHGVHVALVLPQGRVAVVTAYHDYAHFTAGGGWPSEVERDVADALHVPGEP